MSDRLIEAYKKKHEKDVRDRVDNIPWNKAFHERMKAAGRAYRKRHPEGSASDDE